MSDADDQMGGTGGQQGLDPARVVPGRDAAPADPPHSDETGTPDATDDDAVDEAERESFPASDPPSSY